MDIKEAAEALGVSTRHIHRLIRDKSLPAKKTTKMVTVTVTKPIHIWDIDNEAIAIARELMETRPVDNKGLSSWIRKWTKRLDIPLERLTQMTRIKKDILISILDASEEYQEDKSELTSLVEKLSLAFMRESIKQRADTRE